MQVIESVKDMQTFSASAKKRGTVIGLVPTMGYLHAGHGSLMVEGRKLSQLLVASIFVNPTQFGIGEDFESYPRNLDGDLAIAANAGVDVVFAPKAAEIYPDGFQSYVNTEKITLPLCGGSRPGHFRGVTTVVAKLFNMVLPDIALFGKKDFQQLAVIRRMTMDLNFPVKIIGMPIVREADGLAMSSRNAYLSTSERQDALCLKSCIDQARAAYLSGECSRTALQTAAQWLIAAVSSAKIDYIEFCDSRTLETVETVDENTLMALAVRVGKTRLIDNTVFGENQ
ncbi:MAG: pantoate--beta-alanine ligase [Geobacteraceae bacterium]|nr:pantoate--beta-alanine ligase [Geobacteraceae bacterium]